MEAQGAMRLRLDWAVAALALLAAAPALAHPVTIQDVARSDGGYDVWLENSLPGPATVDFELTQLQNAAPAHYVPSLVVPARGRVLVARVQARDRRQAFHYRHFYWYQLGSRDARPDDTVYRLPYRGSRARRVLQGYDGRFSHQNAKAIDLEMPEGTTVLAARGGVVLSSEWRHSAGGATPEMRDQANYVLIGHDDGTIGCYFHLAHRGVLVPVGKRVAAGEPIGLSGNTGYSTAPHLHFEVRVPESGKASRTIATPFRTMTADDEGEQLEEGRSYLAP